MSVLAGRALKRAARERRRQVDWLVTVLVLVCVVLVCAGAGAERAAARVARLAAVGARNWRGPGPPAAAELAERRLGLDV